MLNDWNLSVPFPVLKKEDLTICANYRAISLLPIVYKVLKGVLCKRLRSIVKTRIDPYMCGFRPGKFTIDQAFTLRQILGNIHEKQVNTPQLSVDYKAAIRDRVFAAMSELGILAKLIRLSHPRQGRNGPFRTF